MRRWRILTILPAVFIAGLNFNDHRYFFSILMDAIAVAASIDVVKRRKAPILLRTGAFLRFLLSRFLFPIFSSSVIDDVDFCSDHQDDTGQEEPKHQNNDSPKASIGCGIVTEVGHVERKA